MVSGAVVAGACLVVAPLDDVNQDTAKYEPDSSAGVGGTAGEGGSAGTGGSDDGSAAECATNQDCLDKHPDEQFRCLQGHCVNLRTQECPVVLGRFDHPNAIFIGGFASFQPLQIGDDNASWNYELAINELNAGQVGGLRGKDGLYPLALVLCDAGTQQADPIKRRNGVFAALEHLTDTVRVPAVIANVESGILLEAFDRFGAKKGVFFLTPGPATTAMLTVPSQELLWHMLGLPADLAPTYPALLAKVEEEVKPIFAVNDLKVALVATEEPVEVELRNAVANLLVFNGAGIADNRTRGLFTEVTLPRNPTAQQVASAALAVVAFRPNIVVSVAGTAFSMGRTAAFPQSGVLAQIEKGWGSVNNRPYYILAPFNLPTAISAIIPMITGLRSEWQEPDMHKRFVGIGVAGSEDGVLYNEYRDRLQRVDTRSTPGYENYYDAVYFAAFAIQAAGPKAQGVFGTELDNGIRHLITGGPVFNVGPTDIQSVFDELERPEPNGRLRLFGTLGPPRFDARYGVRVDTGAVYCFEKKNTEELALQSQVGYFDRDAPTPRLQVSRLFVNKTLPCLQELNLPLP